MPRIYAEIEQLKTFYQPNWDTFYKSYVDILQNQKESSDDLAQIITSSKTSSLEIFLAALSEVRIHKRMNSGLQTFFQSERVKAWTFLYDHYLLNDTHKEDNFDAVGNHADPINCARALGFIHEAVIFKKEEGWIGLLSDKNQGARENREIIARIPELGLIILNSWKIQINCLRNSGLLTKERAISAGFKLNEALSPAGIANMLILAQSDYPYTMTSALKTMHEGGLLKENVAEKNRRALLSLNPRCIALISGEGILKNYLATKDLLTGDNAQANFDAIVNHPNQKSVGVAFTYLSNCGFYPEEISQNDFDLILHHPNPSKPVQTLIDNGQISWSPHSHAYFVSAMKQSRQEPNHVKLKALSLGRYNKDLNLATQNNKQDERLDVLSEVPSKPHHKRSNDEISSMRFFENHLQLPRDDKVAANPNINNDEDLDNIFKSKYRLGKDRESTTSTSTRAFKKS